EQERGRFDVHAPITDSLPWFEVRSRFAPITGHHLLSHSAGIASGFDFSPDSRAQVWSLRETDAKWPPGERFFYSNDGDKALGLALRAITGEPYAQTITRDILAPLGMDRTRATVTLDTHRTLATGYAPFYDDRPPPPDEPIAP